MGFFKTVFLVLCAFGLFGWFYGEQLKNCPPLPNALDWGLAVQVGKTLERTKQ